MANDYSLVVNSSFTPLSFEEWLAPAILATTEHKDIQENLAKLQEDANIWENMISPDNDPGANAMYQNYAEALRKRADNLQRYGLNYNSRKSMYDIKARYNSEIKPIETAFNRRRELAKSQSETISKDPTHMFQRDASKMSLDTFISDPEANYGWETSGALITSQVSQAAKALAKQLRSGDGKGILKKLGIPYMWDYIHQHGYTDKEVLQAILRDKDASPVLTNLVEQVMQASGVYGTGDTGLINKTREYANLGLYDAIGEATNQVLTDQAGLTAYKASLSAPPLTTSKLGNSLPTSKHDLIATDEMTEQAKKDGQRLKKIMGLKIDENGQKVHSKYLKAGEVTLEGMPSDPRMPTSSFTPVHTTNPDNGVAYCNSKGYIFDRKRFIDQGKTDDDKKALGTYYDKTLLPLLDRVNTFGPNQNRHNIVDIYSSVEDAIEGGGGAKTASLELRFTNNNSTLEKYLLPGLIKGDKIDLQQISEIHSDGTFKTDPKLVKKSDILNESGTVKGGKALIYVAPALIDTRTGRTPTKGQLLIQLDGKLYVVNRKTLGSHGEGAWNINLPELESLQKQRQDYITNYGLEAYLTSGAANEIESAMEANGSAALWQIYSSLGWSVSPTSAKLSYTSTSQPFIPIEYSSEYANLVDENEEE